MEQEAMKIVWSEVNCYERVESDNLVIFDRYEEMWLNKGWKSLQVDDRYNFC